jgi:hypothetical protein
MASKENVSIIMDLYNYIYLEIQMFGIAIDVLKEMLFII